MGTVQMFCMDEFEFELNELKLNLKLLSLIYDHSPNANVIGTLIKLSNKVVYILIEITSHMQRQSLNDLDNFNICIYHLLLWVENS